MTNTNKPVKLMTIRQTAKTGILPEHAIRSMVKQNKIPVLYIGKKALINYNFILEYLYSVTTSKNIEAE